MKLSVKNAKDFKLTSLIKKATKFYANLLLDSDTINELQINIIFCSKMKGGGNICYEEFLTSPRKFNITLLKYKKYTNILKVLAHEMVHVKQYAYNELIEKRNGNASWLGTEYQNTLYWDQPWEIEAYGLENGLFAKFIQHYDLYKQLRERRSTWAMD